MPENYANLLTTLQGHCDVMERDYDSIVKSRAIECLAVAETHEAAQVMAQAKQLRSFRESRLSLSLNLARLVQSQRLNQSNHHEQTRR